MKSQFSFILFLCLVCSIHTIAQDSTGRLKDSTLANVVVNSQKRAIERKADKTVINVDAFISSTGSNALEVLERSPGVQVDNNDAISLKGKQGVVIYIDDKPSYLSGTDLANYLKSLPASSLDKIEIMTTPPARYDAAGNAGVINIKTKKGKTKGFNGNYNASHRQGVYGDIRSSLNFNYRNKKFNFFTNASFSSGQNFSDLDIARRYRNHAGEQVSSFAQNTYNKRWYKSTVLKLGMDYTLNKRSTIGFVLSGMQRPSTEKRDNTGFFYNAANATDSMILADNFERESFKNKSANLNYRLQIDSSGRELSMDADYIRYDMGADQLFKNASVTAGNVQKYRDELSGMLPSFINIYSYKFDYTHPLQKGLKMETGIKTSYTSTDNDAKYFVTEGNVTSPDYDKTNHFIYKENINAAYVNFSKELKRVSLQAGLRAEQTISKGYQAGNIQKPDSSFKKNYTNLFPTLFASFKLDSNGNHSLNFSYSRRLDRPYYADLNPFVSPLDKFTYYAGNPFLKPQFTHHFELTHTFKNNFNTSFFYDHVKDEMNETIELSGNTFISRTGNIGKKVIAGFTIDGTIKVAKWYNILPYVEYNFRRTLSRLYTETIDNQGSVWVFNCNNQFNFTKGWSAELFFFYRTKMLNGQFRQGEMGLINGGVKKKILKDKASVRVFVQDFFYSRVNKGDINNLKGGEGNYHNVGDSRAIIIGFAYSFSKGINADRKERKNGADAETNRVKN
ncbi:outer membrane beta-barrel protein [Ferruginibacter sp. HRS2-29]|uniref:outer membrane beta-barrel protein n=1 Tax=Ferruginibacter sp. HRS2-29 TaxID=2487334 RepID=UPI0020CC8AEA|nr:outer membrane beta-barrel protein [Ferruginibacter sp. HRS2-29]MCP9752890.1 TonB-dependent receptor [Ferruginibacter sp. HRS2-29]